jgi:hypothetical protein
MSSTAPADETWWADTKRAMQEQDAKDRIRMRELIVEVETQKRTIGDLERDLETSRKLAEQYRDRIRTMHVAVANAKAALAAHDDVDDDRILACVYESLEAVVP